jgi:hypothetical protein
MEAILDSSPTLPAFGDAADCVLWLRSVPLISVVPAQRQLAARLAALNAAEIAAPQRWEILETLRQPVVFVQAEIARSFTGKPLPLEQGAVVACADVAALWEELRRGYELVSRGLAGHSSAAMTVALQRALDCVARNMFDHHVAHAKVAPELYAELHRLYRLVEKLSCADAEVTDPLALARAHASCARTWVRALLLDAANPGAQLPRETQLLSRLIELWAAKVGILIPSVDAAAPRRALWVDIDHPGGASRTPLEGGGCRVLDLSKLARSIARRVKALRQGTPPHRLGLPRDCSREGCESLLTLLYRRCCQSSPDRAHSRAAMGTTAAVCSGVASAYYYLAAGPFHPPDEPAPSDGEVYRLEHGISDEAWRMRDESAGGLGLVRPAELAGDAQLCLGQLLLVRPPGGVNVLAVIRWLQQAAAGEVEIGTRLIAASPQPVTVRAADGGDWHPALLLPVVRGEGQTLICPTDKFNAGQVIEVYPDKTYTASRDVGTMERMRLTALVSQGPDFTRLGLEPYGQ